MHWTPEQDREFLELMQGDRTYPVWAFLLGSGLRIGELVWLRWANVDLARRHVAWSSLPPRWATTWSRPLARAGRPCAPSSSTMVWSGCCALSARRKTRSLASATYVPSGFVFTKVDGGWYHPQYLSRLIGRYSEELQLPRCWRVVCPKVAAERLGHADPTLFTNLYSHVTPTMQRDAADKIGSALFD